KPRRQRAVSPAADSQARPQPPAESRARLLDPRLEVVGFMGRQRELAALLAWCEDDQAGRLRLVTGSGWVGKPRLAGCQLLTGARKRSPVSNPGRSCPASARLVPLAIGAAARGPERECHR